MPLVALVSRLTGWWLVKNIEALKSKEIMHLTYLTVTWILLVIYGALSFYFRPSEYWSNNEKFYLSQVSVGHVRKHKLGNITRWKIDYFMFWLKRFHFTYRIIYKFLLHWGDNLENVWPHTRLRLPALRHESI